MSGKRMGTETAAICGGVRPRIRLYGGSAVSGSVPEMQNSRRNAVKMNRKNLKFRAAVPVSAGLDGQTAFQAVCDVVSGPSQYLITATYMHKEEKDGIYALMRKLKTVPDTPAVTNTESYAQ